MKQITYIRASKRSRIALDMAQAVLPYRYRIQTQEGTAPQWTSEAIETAPLASGVLGEALADLSERLPGGIARDVAIDLYRHRGFGLLTRREVDTAIRGLAQSAGLGWWAATALYWIARTAGRRAWGDEG
jgi:hypothetical protein